MNQCRRSKLILAIAVSCLTWGFGPRAFSQATSGTIQGLVKDSTGAGIVDAAVTAKNETTGLTRKAGTDASGYTLYNLPPGTYTITVAKAGFKTASRSGLLLVIDQKLRLDLELVPGSVTESVTVKGEAPLLQTQTMETGEVIQSRQILDLPLLNRDFLQLAKLTPGVLTGSGGNGVNLTVNGQREFANSVMIDGIEATGNRNNDSGLRPSVDAVEEFKIETSAYSAEYGRAAGGVISIETKSGSNKFHGSVYEFYRPNTTAAATYTFSGPPQRSQLKQHSFGVTFGGPIKKNKMFFFGSFEGFRVRDVFVYPDSVPPAGQINYLPNGDVDLSGLIDPNTGNQIPIFDPEFTAANFGGAVQQFPGNIIPADRVSPAGKAVLQNFFPVPDLPGDHNGWFSNFMDRQIFRENFNNGDGRYDWDLSAKDRLSVEYHYGDYDILTGDRFAGHIPVQGGGDGDAGDAENARDQGIYLSQTHSFSDRWLNEFRFGYSRFRLDELSLLNGRNLADQFGQPNVNVPGFPATSGFPDTYLGTGFFTGGSTFKPLLFLDNNIQVYDSISAKLGHHDFKAGVDYRRLRSNPNFSIYPTGFQYYAGQFASLTSDPTFSFYDPAAFYGNGGSDVADLLLGLPQSVSIGLQLTNPTTKSWEMHFYGQDSWQATKRLVLSYGLRYEFQKPYGEVHDHVSNFDLATLSISIAGRGGNSGTLVRDDRNNFAPRVGISYQFTPRTVVRAGYGVYYTPENDERSDALTQNYPFAVQQLFVNSYLTPPYPYVLDAGIPRITQIPLTPGVSSIPAADILGGTTQSLFYLDPNFRTGYSQLYNFTLEQELSTTASLEIGYVGSLSRKLPYAVGDINRIDPVTTKPRISDLLGPISAQYAIGSGHYHSLQSKLTKRLSNHMSFLASYTWGKSIDNGPAPFNLGHNLNRNNQPQDPLNLAAERAVSDSDVTHNLVVSAIYELPFGNGKRFFATWHGARQALLGGWQMNTIFSARTGLPVNVVQHAQKQPNPGLRPNLVADPILPHSERTLDRYFNTAAFCVPKTNPDPNCPALGPNSIGSAGRNPVRGPGFVNFDYSLFKDFAFSENKKLQVRLEAFNLLNTPHFSNPEGDFGNGANFGRIRGTVGNPRILQFAAKFLF
jgi:carboxypeptidase family protein/TonB-dependent receptor-like protein